MTWAPPGKTASPARWRYDLRQGYVPPGHASDPEGTQYELPPNWTPQGAPQGFHVVESPPGTTAPIDAINYTPDGREVSDVGVMAPVDKTNYSLIPNSGLQRLVSARRQHMQGVGVGSGADSPGQPPLALGPFSPDTQSRGSNRPSLGVPNAGMSVTSAPPGAPYGRQPLGIGSGADANGLSPGDPGYDPSTETDPTVGVDAGTATSAGGSPSGYDPTRPADPNWDQVGPEYTGTRQVDPNTVAEFALGKVLGYWVRKPGATDLDPNAWSFRSAPAAQRGSTQVTYTQEPQSDGSIKLIGSNGDVRFVKPPAPAKASTQTTYSTPYVDQDGNLVQQGSNGEIRVISKASTTRSSGSTAATQDWSDPYQQPDGTWVQKNLTTGQIRAVPEQHQTASTEQSGPLVTKPDGSVWQQNLTTKAWRVVQAPTNPAGPVTVGNRIVQYQPDPNGGPGKYTEVYKAPANLQLMTQADGTIVGIDPETGNAKPLMSDPNAAADERLKRVQTQMQVASTEMGMIPQVSDVGGNIIVPQGAQADISYWDPRTGQTTQTQVGTRQSVPDIMKSYGLDTSYLDTPKQFDPQTTPASPAVAAASTTPEASTPLPTQTTPQTQSTDQFVGISGYGTPSGYQGAPNPNIFGSAPDSVTLPPTTPTPFAQSDIPEGSDRNAVPDQTDTGAGADKGSSYDLQKDIGIDIPTWARDSSRRWKGLGSKYLGKGLDDFTPYVGMGQDNTEAPSAPGAAPAPLPPPKPPSGVRPAPGGGGVGKWNPQQLQQILPILLMLLAGGSGGMPGTNPPGGAVPTPTPPAPPSPMPQVGGGMGGGAGMPAPGGMPGDMPGAGAESPQGKWTPPVDPSSVVGTGHKFGQKMGVGDPVHHGVDLQAEKGTPAKAPVDGVVQLRQNPKGLGNEVAIVGQDGKEHRLGHLNTVSVKQGQQVKAGQVVGTVGDSGLTTGSNLHYDIRKGNQHFDPSKRLGVLANMKPAAGTEMMTQSAMGGGPGAGAEGGVGAGATYTLPDTQTGKSQTVEAGSLQEAESQAQSRGTWSPAAGTYGSGSLPGGGGPSGGQPSGGGQQSGGAPSGAGTRVAVDPATQAQVQESLQAAQMQNAAAMAQVQANITAENNRHAESLQQLQQQAQQEADWRAVQDAVDAENTRHNQVSEQLQQQSQQLQVELQNAQEQAQAAEQGQSLAAQAAMQGQSLAAQAGEQTQAEEFQSQQTAQSNALNILQSALNSPWLQALTNLGITPNLGSGSAVGGVLKGQNPLMALLNRILGSAGQAPGVDVPGVTIPGVNVPQVAVPGNVAGVGGTTGGGGTAGGTTSVQQGPFTQYPQGTVVRTSSDQFGVVGPNGTLQPQTDANWPVIYQAIQQNSGIMTVPDSLFQQGVQQSQQAPQTPATPAPATSAPAGLQTAPSPYQGSDFSTSGFTIPGQGWSSLGNAGVSGYQLPSITLDQWNAMSVPEKAALQAQINALGPGAWQQFQANFQQQYGSQAPNMTQLQSEIQTPEQQVGTQMNAQMFGEGPQSYQQRQTQNWDASKGTNVMQSLLQGTGYG